MRNSPYSHRVQGACHSPFGAHTPTKGKLTRISINQTDLAQFDRENEWAQDNWPDLQIAVAVLQIFFNQADFHPTWLHQQKRNRRTNCSELSIPLNLLIGLINWYMFYNNSFLVVDVFRYFFPTYENDALLCSLEDDEDEDEKEEENNPKESNKNSTDRS